MKALANTCLLNGACKSLIFSFQQIFSKFLYSSGLVTCFLCVDVVCWWVIVYYCLCQVVSPGSRIHGSKVPPEPRLIPRRLKMCWKIINNSINISFCFEKENRFCFVSEVWISWPLSLSYNVDDNWLIMIIFSAKNLFQRICL